MKNKHIFWGILFISIGIFILVNNLTSYDFYFYEVWKVWPLVLILWGLTLLIRQAALRSILVAFTAFTLAFALYSSFKSGFNIFHFRFDFDDDDVETVYDDKLKNFTESFSNTTKQATLNFDAGAGTFIIRESTGEMFEAVTEGIPDKYELNRSDSGDETIIDFVMKKKRFSFRGGSFKNKVVMKLNSIPVWNLNINIGAASTDLDLSQIKVGKLNIDMGAASLNVKLPEPDKESHVEIDAGVSSIDIFIPENTGCEINADVSLSSKSFEGFIKNNDDIYRSENFNSSEKKIFIELNTGVSSIKVKRYSGW